jgi:hypothetical protein
MDDGHGIPWCGLMILYVARPGVAKGRNVMQSGGSVQWKKGSGWWAGRGAGIGLQVEVEGSD